MKARRSCFLFAETVVDEAPRMALALRISSISTSLKFVSGVGSVDEGSSADGGGSAREGRLIATDFRRNTRPARRSLASFEAPVA